MTLVGSRRLNAQKSLRREGTNVIEFNTQLQLQLQLRSRGDLSGRVLGTRENGSAGGRLESVSAYVALVAVHSRMTFELARMLLKTPRHSSLTSPVGKDSFVLLTYCLPGLPLTTPRRLIGFGPGYCSQVERQPRLVWNDWSTYGIPSDPGPVCGSREPRGPFRRACSGGLSW